MPIPRRPHSGPDVGRSIAEVAGALRVPQVLGCPAPDASSVFARFAWSGFFWIPWLMLVKFLNAGGGGG